MRGMCVSGMWGSVCGGGGEHRESSGSEDKSWPSSQVCPADGGWWAQRWWLAGPWTGQPRLED